MDYIIHLGILVGIYLILAQAFNLCFGLGGLFNLAHVAAYSIGAYTAALLTTDGNVSTGIAILAAVGASSLLAIILGGIALRLTQDYFAIGTLAFASIISALLINWKSITRGVLGIPGIPRPEIPGLDLYSNFDFLLFVYAFTIPVLFFIYFLFKGRFARALRAQSEFDQAASSLGIDTRFLRNTSFAISSGLAGLAGAIFAFYLNYIDPTSFSLDEMVFVFTIVMIGKPGSFWGTIAATIFLVLLPEPLRFIDMPAGILGPARQALYALILFIVVFIKRKSLFPIARTI